MCGVGADQKLVFCRITQLGFLGLLTNTHVMEEEVMNPDRRGKPIVHYGRIGESATWPSQLPSLNRGMHTQKAG